MNKYLITYDLKTAPRDYNPLYEAIKQLPGQWWHYLESTWIIKDCNLTAEQVFERLRPHLNLEKDYALVIKIDTSNKEGWLPRAAWDWLNTA